MGRDPRRAQFEHFRNFRDPTVGLTAEVDITHLRQRCKTEDWPFFLTLLYCAVGAANAVPELRRRIEGDQVVEYDHCLSSHTVARENGTYTYCDLDCAGPFAEYLPRAQAEVERQLSRNDLDDGDEVGRMFFVSSVPWVSFTGLHLPVAEPPGSNPAITFGKFFQRDGRVLLPVDLTVHHALVDGLHISRFFEEMQRRVEEI